MWKKVQEALRRLGGELPLLDPLENMGIDDPAFTKLVSKAASLQSRLASNALFKKKNKQELLDLYAKKVEEC